MSDPVDILRAFLKAHSIGLGPLLETEDHRAAGVRMVDIWDRSTRRRISVPVHPEHFDIDHASQVLLLHLVLEACEIKETTHSFEEWAVEAEVAATEWSRALHDVLDQRFRELRSMLSTDIKAISSWDIQLGTDVARTLEAVTDG